MHVAVYYTRVHVCAVSPESRVCDGSFVVVVLQCRSAVFGKVHTDNVPLAQTGTGR